MLPEIIRDLLESGVHFGHLSKHWNPKMKKFIFGKKKNIYIIDLEKTAQKLEEAKQFLVDTVKNNGKILFVSTKRQLREVVKELALTCEMPYICEKWVGGFLTNFSTIRSRINRYLDLKERKEKGELLKLPHKEIVSLNKELERMQKVYLGVTSLKDLPQCIYLVDPKKEVACVKEANKLSIPIVALIDTDGDPDVITYPVPGNDDAIKSVKFITQYLVEAVSKELQELKVKTMEEEAAVAREVEHKEDKIEEDKEEEVKSDKEIIKKGSKKTGRKKAESEKDPQQKED